MAFVLAIAKEDARRYWALQSSEADSINAEFYVFVTLAPLHYSVINEAGSQEKVAEAASVDPPLAV